MGITGRLLGIAVLKYNTILAHSNISGAKKKAMVRYRPSAQAVATFTLRACDMFAVEDLVFAKAAGG